MVCLSLVFRGSPFALDLSADQGPCRCREDYAISASGRALMNDESHVPEFLTRQLPPRSRRLVLRTIDEVRAHCLTRGPTNTNYIALTVRGDEFRYKIRASKKIASGWQVAARIPPSRKVTSREGGVRKQTEALVGHIGADFRFKRRGKSLPDNDPIVRAFVLFHDLIFVRNVMRPIEMKIEAEFPIHPKTPNKTDS
jgi:hypothetical protein